MKLIDCFLGKQWLVRCAHGFSAPDACHVQRKMAFVEYLWVVIVGSIFAFAASFGIGANDVGMYRVVSLFVPAKILRG